MFSDWVRVHVNYASWSIFDFIDWLGCKQGFFCFFSTFSLVALYTPCILSGVIQAFFIQLLLLIKKK